MNEITRLDIYWITRLDMIQGAMSLAVGLLGAAAIILTVIGGMMRSDGAREEGTKLQRHLRWILPFAVVLGLGVVLIPTTKEAIAIIVIPRIANGQEVRGVIEWITEQKKEADSR